MRVPPLPADEWDEAVDHALSGMLPPERPVPAFALAPVRRGLAESIESVRVTAAGD